MHTSTIAGAPAPEAPVRRRVFILDDHAFFASCLRALLDNEPDFQVCDVADSTKGLTARVQRAQPDVLVIDIALGAENGLAVGRELRAAGVAAPVMFVSSLSTPSPAELAGVGSSHFVPKGEAPGSFLTALRAAVDRHVTPAAEAVLGVLAPAV